MNKRTLLPLALLAADDEQPIEGRTRLQKLLFLAQKHLEEQGEEPENSYEFVAYDYGPFSKEIYDDVDELEHRGLIEETPKEMDDGVIAYDFKLTEKGHQFIEENSLAESEVLEALEKQKQEYWDTELQELIDDVYTEYPEYAEESVLY